MKSHFQNISKNPNDFQETLFNDISEDFLSFKIAPDNSFHKVLIGRSIYKTFGLPTNFISDTFLSLFYNSIHKEDRIKVLRLFIQLKKTERKAEIDFKSLLPKKGMSVFKAHIKTKLNSNGETVFYIQFFKTGVMENQDLNLDVIAQKKEKETNLVLQQYKEHNSRLLNFSHITSHNLNTHAGNIKMLLDMIDTEDNNETAGEYLNHLRTVSNNLTTTIAHLSQIVNVQNNLTVTREPLDLNSFLEKNNSIINNYGLENNINIINKIPKGSTINFNAAYLESILLNFTTNAVKYAHPERFPILTFEFFTENDKKVLTISDNGLGIDLEKHGHSLFGMYKTFHKHQNANGVGLYITKNQIEAMNGEISVESKVNEGTTFKIIFSN